MSTLDVLEIMKYIPQRSPFLLIDRVIELIPSDKIVAIKNITVNEPYFAGHFPGNPVMPGVLILEAMAQASIVLACKSFGQTSDDTLYLFAGIDKARFRRVVVPGDQLVMEVKLTQNRKRFLKVQAEARVDGELACSAEMMSVIGEK